jgi:hypothetical protein
MNINLITVIGSGINSYFFIINSLKRGKKITLIDRDISQHNYNIEQAKYDNSYSPKILLNKFQKNIKIFQEVNKFTYKNFNTQAAISIGGLSNVWGGTVYKFNEQELIKNHLNNFNLFKYMDSLNTQQYQLKSPTKDKYFEKNINNKEYQVNYNYLLLNNQNKPFNVSDEIKKLIRSGKIKFISGLVENIEYKESYYRIAVNDGKEIFYLNTKRIILGAGSLSTTKLLMQLLKIKKKKLLCTPLSQNLIITQRRQKNNNINCLLSFNKKENTKISSHIFPLNGIDNKIIFQYLNLNKKIFNSVINFIKPYIYGIYTYHDSDYSDVTINSVKNNFIVQAQNLNTLQIEKKNFYNLRIMKVPMTEKLLLQGNDNHIGGSFPFKDYFNNLNEFKKFKNLHVIDGTYLNYIPPLGYTLITILNSIRIAKNIT